MYGELMIFYLVFHVASQHAVEFIHKPFALLAISLANNIAAIITGVVVEGQIKADIVWRRHGGGGGFQSIAIGITAFEWIESCDQLLIIRGGLGYEDLGVAILCG